METRFFYSIALIVAVIVGVFYYYSGNKQNLANSGRQNLNSTATHIQVLQTNDMGQVTSHITATDGIQWMKTGEAEVHNIQGIMYSKGLQDGHFSADKATTSGHLQDVVLSGHVNVVKGADNAPQTTLTTTQLHFNTKTKDVYSDQPVEISNAQGQLNGQRFDGNLTTEQYNFSRIRGQYVSKS